MKGVAGEQTDDDSPSDDQGESRMILGQDEEIVLLVESAGELLPVWFDDASGSFDPYDVGDAVREARNATVVAILARVQRIVSRDVPVGLPESAIFKRWRHD